MGLIRVALGAVGGVISDQYKEYFICDMLWTPGFDLPPYQFTSDSSCCVHDWAAVAPAIDPATATDVRCEVCRVDCSGGMADGQLVIDRRGYGFARNAAVVYNMDEPRCKSLLLSLLANC